MHLAKTEIFELGAIPVAIAWVAWLTPSPGMRLEIGELLAAGALSILLQGFGRDLWLLRQARRQPEAAATREVSCMCVESAIGLAGVVAGIGLVGFDIGMMVFLSPTVLAASTGLTLLAGYLLKDFVFGWSPWKIYREKNHAQLIVRWGR